MITRIVLDVDVPWEDVPDDDEGGPTSKCRIMGVTIHALTHKDLKEKKQVAVEEWAQSLVEEALGSEVRK